MAKVGLKIVSGAKKRYKAMVWCFSLVVAMTLLSPLGAVCAAELLIDSSNYKDKDFIKGCISNYSDMVKGDDIDWVWISPGTLLAQNRISIGKFENASDELRSTQFEGVKTTFKEILSKVKGETLRRRLLKKDRKLLPIFSLKRSPRTPPMRYCLPRLFTLITTSDIN